jgi:subtilisin family serine protease
VKRLMAVVGGAALVVGVFVPINQVTAQDLPAVDTSLLGSKAVVESDTGSYIVVMKADPLVASIPQEQLSTPAAEAQGDALDSSHDVVLAESGVSTSTKVQDFTNALNGFSAVLNYDDAVKLAANPKVSIVLPNELRHVTAVDGADQGSRDDDGDHDGHDRHDRVSQKNDDLGNFLGLTDKGEAWKSGLTGEGVVVGVIDTGIWPEHPSFADDGTFPAHDPLDSTDSDPCNFGNAAANPNDAPFVCNNKLIGARQMLDTYRLLIGSDDDEFDSARDDDGHGTHTASTAAGNANVTPVVFGRTYPKISGIAPRAQIIAYKALGNLGGFTSDLVSAIDQAVADGVDVINYSIGGGPILVDADTIAFLFAADAGVFAAVSAGNDGPDPETVGGPADVPWVTAVGANTQRRSFNGTIKLDNGKEFTGASVTLGTNKLPLVDAEFAGTSDLCLADSLDPAKVTGKIVLCRRGGNGRVAKSEEVFRAGGKGMILFNASDDDNLFTDNHWVPTVHIDLTEGEKIKDYIASSSRPRARIKTEKPGTIDYAPSMTIFSSRGPNATAADIIKPDITAPGLQVMAGASPFTDAGFVPGELFQAIAGTSMSSPVTAGIYALLKQAHPDWSPAMAKSALMGTANTDVLDNDRVSQAGPFAMGAGMVNPGKVAKPGSAFNPGLVYDAGFVDYLGFLCDAGPEIFANPAATCAFLAANGIQTQAENLNYPSIGISQLPGAATITRTITSVANKTVTFTASGIVPDGYEASVNPDTITLAPGESASFEATITNVSAPLNEWRFGQLVWSGGGYHVSSPVAVRAVALGTPLEISGTGADGVTSFDVEFGYTGAYSAAAHGLVPATSSDGTVLHDEDQTFPSPDDGAGGVLEFPFDISAVSVARWSLVIPGDDDIDLYLTNSANEIVAQSTSGGTNEFIELQHPADDLYTLHVHGWSITNPAGLAFSVQSWLVPEATGGSLTIVSAPTEAVNATSGTIDLAWAGLTPGVSYLGTVSHSDDAGEMAITVVSVDA